VEFRPLAGLEYDTDAAGDFGSLIAPPFDVISADEGKALAAKSPYNIVHVTLPEAAGGLDKYAAAGELVRRWISQGVLKRSAEAFYVIEQSFDLGSRKRVRTGILGQARLARWREGGIFPHELTLPQPKIDRLNLYRAARVVPGPCFSLFEDKAGAVRAAMLKIKSSPPYRTADGPEGSFDRIWKVTDADALRAMSAAFAAEDLFIADGHHRYETALAYRDERAAKEALAADHNANFVLMCAVAFDDPGLVMLPTHRLLCLEGEADATRAFEALSRDYEIENVESLDDFAEAGGAPRASIAVYEGHRHHLVRMKRGSRDRFIREAGAIMAGVNVYEVRYRILPRFLKDVAGAIASERVKYTHEVAEAIARVDRGECQAAVILAPLEVRQMAAVAAAGRTMPPKSTYFYPKLPTGVVVKRLE